MPPRLPLSECPFMWPYCNGIFETGHWFRTRRSLTPLRRPADDCQRDSFKPDVGGWPLCRRTTLGQPTPPPAIVHNHHTRFLLMQPPMAFWIFLSSLSLCQLSSVCWWVERLLGGCCLRTVCDNQSILSACNPTGILKLYGRGLGF